MLDAYAIRTNVALNGPASELTVQAVQREILQKNQRCNDGQAVDRDRPQLSHRPHRLKPDRRERAQRGESRPKRPVNQPPAVRLQTRGRTLLGGLVSCVPLRSSFVDERALRRYLVRFGTGEVRIVGTGVEFRLEQDLFDEAGNSIGIGVVVVGGKRRFGGLVELLVADLEVTGGGPDELDFLRVTAEVLIATLKDLCLCGRFRATCDCCPSCRGSGIDEGTICTACGGDGFSS